MITARDKKNKKHTRLFDWINPNWGHLRAGESIFVIVPLCVLILNEMALNERGGKRQHERSWRRTASSQLEQRAPADLDPGWVGMILAKQLREMTAVRQGQTDRDSSLSPSLLSMFSFYSLPPVMAIDFSQLNKKPSLNKGGWFINKKIFK